MGLRYCIAGSRTLLMSSDMLLSSLNLLRVTMLPEHDSIISGGCPTGPDRAAKELAGEMGIEYLEIPADWELHGKAAGPIRNKQMANLADVLILIWDGESRGSQSILKAMRTLGKPVFELIVKSPLKG